MKKIIYTLLSLIVIVTVAVIILFDSIGKKISQQYATELLKTPVKISQFSSDFSKKSINIDFIEVKNPPNFNKKNALSLDHFSLKVGDINDDFIIIDELVFDGLEFILDQNGGLKSGTALIYSCLPFANSLYENIKMESDKALNIYQELDKAFIKR